jgi:hypothetical protein
MSEVPAVKANERPTFRLLLRPEPGVEPERALRWALKILPRRCRLKCISVERVEQP